MVDSFRFSVKEHEVLRSADRANNQTQLGIHPAEICRQQKFLVKDLYEVDFGNRMEISGYFESKAAHFFLNLLWISNNPEIGWILEISNSFRGENDVV